MKIIFLDIDGVLNTRKNYKQLVDANEGIESWHFNNAFDKECMLNLKMIIEATNARVVIQSTRRFSEALMIPLEIQFSQYGLLPYLLDRTPTMGNQNVSSLERQYAKLKEIKAWLERQENVESYVIIDDVNTFEELNVKLAQCNPYDGITEEIVSKAIAILTK